MKGGMTMIDVSTFPLLCRNRNTLKETSKDNHNGTAAYMTESQHDVINFDAVKTEYVEPLKLKKIPTSNDALFAYVDGRLAFIEFKNGCMKKKDYCVRKKIYDSLLMFSDITHEGISYTRVYMDYILVYNEEKNPEENDEHTSIGVSSARDGLAKKVLGLGNQPFIKYGLEIFKDYCFKNVYTYTEREFEEKFVKMHTQTGQA